MFIHRSLFFVSSQYYFLFHFSLLGFNFFFSDFFFQFLCFFLHSFRVSSVFFSLLAHTIHNLFFFLTLESYSQRWSSTDFSCMWKMRPWLRRSSMRLLASHKTSMGAKKKFHSNFSGVHFIFKHSPPAAILHSIIHFTQGRKNNTKDLMRPTNSICTTFFLLLSLFVPLLLLGCG